MASGLGLVHVYTGEGKGKTTAAFGLVLRAWGRGLRICVIQFMKVGEDYGEIQALRRMGGVDLFQFGRDKLFRKGKHTDEDVHLAKSGLERAKKALTSGDYDLVVLDEVTLAADFGLLATDEVLEVVRSRAPEVEVVLTGRRAPKAFTDEADLVTEMCLRKHPYDSGLLARKGIEY
ncbi:MAG TPA: cob(I)yrinic acid a,c-diamide adenosyltransferase [Methanomassiliicoccales archaeon]|nr:cob(I)yrinic acid a,c-diamide adenosyltransferase [Methanomassiliicoccales archaeon]